jgi:hypothetical protein
VSIDDGVGVRDIFGMVWGSIEIISLEKLLYIRADIHSLRHISVIVRL